MHLGSIIKVMSRERGTQSPLPVFDTELSINLHTGEKRLGRRRVTGGKPEARKRIAMSSWQTDLPETLALAAGSWHAARSTQQAEKLGINVEYAGPQMTAAETEDTLVAKFQQAHGLHLRAIDVALRLYWGVADMRERLGTQADWLAAFLNYTIDRLSGVYGLSQQKTVDLKRFVLQRHLPGFTRP